MKIVQSRTDDFQPSLKSFLIFSTGWRRAVPGFFSLDSVSAVFGDWPGEGQKIKISH